MATAYAIIFVAFIPLFVAFTLLLRRSFAQMYEKLKVRLFLSAVIFLLVMGFRFVMYIFIEFSLIDWHSLETIRGEIGLYISEIIIAVCYMSLMVSLYRDEKRKVDPD